MLVCCRMPETRDDGKCIIVISISLDLRDNEEDRGNHGKWISWFMERPMPRKRSHCGSRAGREPREYQPGQRGHESLPSKTQSIAHIDLSSGAAPPALEEEAFFRDAEEQGNEPAHGAALVPALLFLFGEFQNILSLWQLGACCLPCRSGCMELF